MLFPMFSKLEDSILFIASKSSLLFDLFFSESKLSSTHSFSSIISFISNKLIDFLYLDKSTLVLYLSKKYSLQNSDIKKPYS